MRPSAEPKVRTKSRDLVRRCSATEARGREARLSQGNGGPVFDARPVTKPVHDVARLSAEPKGNLSRSRTLGRYLISLKPNRFFSYIGVFRIKAPKRFLPRTLHRNVQQCLSDMTGSEQAETSMELGS